MSCRISVPHIRHFSGDGETVGIGGHLGLRPAKYAESVAYEPSLFFEGTTSSAVRQIEPSGAFPVHPVFLDLVRERRRSEGSFDQDLSRCARLGWGVSGAIPTRKGFHLLKTDVAPAACRPSRTLPVGALFGAGVAGA